MRERGDGRVVNLFPVSLYLSLDYRYVSSSAILPLSSFLHSPHRPSPPTAPNTHYFLSPSGLPSLSAFQRMTQQSEVAMASVPFPTATAKMDHDAEVEEEEAVRKASRWSENIGGSPRSAGTSWRYRRREQIARDFVVDGRTALVVWWKRDGGGGRRRRITGGTKD